MWRELDIAPTADPTAIRRAYARRLKALDPDREPAAFLRLRQAFEAALRYAEAGRARPAPPPGDERKEDGAERETLAATEATGGLAIADPGAGENRWHDLSRSIQRALAVGDADRAFT